jgi:hypothetical protein
MRNHRPDMAERRRSFKWFVWGAMLFAGQGSAGSDHRRLCLLGQHGMMPPTLI